MILWSVDGNGERWRQRDSESFTIQVVIFSSLLLNIFFRIFHPTSASQTSINSHIFLPWHTTLAALFSSSAITEADNYFHILWHFAAVLVSDVSFFSAPFNNLEIFMTLNICPHGFSHASDHLFKVGANFEGNQLSQVVSFSFYYISCFNISTRKNKIKEMKIYEYGISL